MLDTKDLTVVTHYGIHYTPEGVAYLHQGRGANNFIGLGQKSPFEVRVPRKGACPHIINTAAPVPDRVHWEKFRTLMSDPLVKEFLPIPKPRGALVPYLSDELSELSLDLVCLSRLSSPIHRAVLDIRQVVRSQVLTLLQSTNVTPLVLTGIRQGHQELVNLLASESRLLPRRLILVGDPHVVAAHPMTRITTEIREWDELELNGLPMESLGAAVLRRFARREPLDTPMRRAVVE